MRGRGSELWSSDGPAAETRRRPRVSGAFGISVASPSDDPAPVYLAT
jgi:hypothetical protein